MLRYELRASDVGDVRFGLSPLCELGLSLRAIHEPSRYPLQLPWLRQTQAARAGLDHEALRALIDDRLWTPDFLNPRPVSPLTRLDDELAALSRIRTTTFHRDLEAIHGSVPAIFAGDPRAAVRRVVAALRALWDAAFAPYWPRMRAVLEADIAYRGRQIAQSGLGAMLNGISSTVSFDGRVISVALRDPVDRTRRTDGQGVTLVPTVFTARASAPVGEAAPLILYPARGQGAMWERQQVTTSAALVGILGRVRAQLLTVLDEPASSTELGVRFGVTTSAAGQHLRALRAAGLVSSTRYGRSVLYLRSELGNALVPPAQGT